MALGIFENAASFDDHGIIDRIDRAHLVHPLQRDDHFATRIARHRRADETGQSALGNNVDFLLVTEGHQLAELFGRAGPRDRQRAAVMLAGPVTAIALECLAIRQQQVCRHGGSEGGERSFLQGRMGIHAVAPVQRENIWTIGSLTWLSYNTGFEHQVQGYFPLLAIR